MLTVRDILDLYRLGKLTAQEALKQITDIIARENRQPHAAWNGKAG